MHKEKTPEKHRRIKAQITGVTWVPHDSGQWRGGGTAPGARLPNSSSAGVMWAGTGLASRATMARARVVMADTFGGELE